MTGRSLLFAFHGKDAELAHARAEEESETRRREKREWEVVLGAEKDRRVSGRRGLEVVNASLRHLRSLLAFSFVCRTCFRAPSTYSHEVTAITLDHPLFYIFSWKR